MNMVPQLRKPEQSIDSNEIADLVEVRPDNVKRTIERLAVRGVITLPPMEEKPTAGRPALVYVFSGEQGKRDSIIVVAQLCPEFTARLVDRWAELEQQVRSMAITLPDFENPAEAARAWAEQFEAKRQAEKQVLELAPKAQALDTIADTTNTYSIRECAKAICIKESELIQLLISKKWIYRDADRKLQPHAQYVQNKVFTNRTSPVIVNRNDGKERVFLHMRVTAFGLTRITGLVNKTRNEKQVAV